MGVAALRDRTGAIGFGTSSAGGAIVVPAARRLKSAADPGRRRELD
jgi:hypothetical protein